MSLDDVEKSLAQLKDITEARSLRRENQALREELDEKERDHQLELADKDNEIMALRACVKGYEAIEIRYKKKQYSLKEFNALVMEIFEDKVKADIVEKVKGIWKRRAPELTISALKEELRKYPGSCMSQTKELIDLRVQTERDIQLRHRIQWPPWFQQIFNSEVQAGIGRGLNAEFNKRVEDQAQSRLHELINIEWPRYIHNVNRFFKRSLGEQLMMLQSPIKVICDRCGTNDEIILSPQDIADLIKKPFIKISCLTEGCKDFLRPHGIPITLADVILQVEKPTIRYKPVEQNKTERDTNVAIF